MGKSVVVIGIHGCASARPTKQAGARPVERQEQNHG